MNVAFFGSSLVSAYWNGAATYYRGLIRALAARGHHVTFYEPDAWDRQRHRDLDDPPWAEVVVYPGTDEAAVHAMLDRASRADVVVKASGVGVFDALLEREVAGLRSELTTTAFWDVDAPATLERVRADPRDPFRALVPEYDLVFTYGGGARAIDTYEALGAARVVPVYNALDPEEHFPVPAEPRFTCDLAFLGNRLPDREARVDALFLAAARRLPSRSFILGGSGWDGDVLPPNVRALGHVYTRDHNALNSSALAVLNVTRDSMVRFGYSPATRVFEAAGAGACLVTDAWEGIEAFLEPGTEVLVAHDGAEVAAHVEALTPARARAIGEAARRRVLDGHTYAHRARQVEEVLVHG
ncbi:glycosyltransferase [Myxococcota bacterium]|nr:glycosyltransferase [Myxococcota bacterium]